MKTGMSRFTKFCLITALVTFILGCLICGVGALLGGFGMLEGMDIHGITGIPFHFHRNANGGIQYGFGWDSDWDDEWNDDWDGDWDDEWNDDWDGDWDDDDWPEYKKWDSINSSDEKTELELTADTLRCLYIELGACELYIMESEDDHVWLSTGGNTKYFRYHVEDGGTLRMVNRTGRGFWNWSQGSITPATKVCLYLPEGTRLDNAEIEIGAGHMDSIALQVHELNMEVGAGHCTVEGIISADLVDLMVGAGKIHIQSMTADKLNMEVGAGELNIENADISGETDLELGMGNVELGGLFQNDMDINCGMGNVTLHLDDAEENHNYEIECSMGNVNLGDTSYTSLSNEKTIFNGSSSTYDIECSMGNVSIDFAE